MKYMYYTATTHLDHTHDYPGLEIVYKCSYLNMASKSEDGNISDESQASQTYKQNVWTHNTEPMGNKTSFEISDAVSLQASQIYEEEQNPADMIANEMHLQDSDVLRPS